MLRSSANLRWPAGQLRRQAVGLRSVSLAQASAVSPAVPAAILASTAAEIAAELSRPTLPVVADGFAPTSAPADAATGSNKPSGAKRINVASVEAAHAPVMTAEVVSALLPASGNAAARRLIIDATVGLGGHADALLRADPSVYLLGVDRDIAAIEAARERLASFGNRVRLVVGSYADLPALLQQAKQAGWPPAAASSSSLSVSGILLDLGTGSHHLDEAGRGFSFQADGALDMRFASPHGDSSSGESGLTAGEVVSRWSGARLSALFSTYGDLDQHVSHAIARAIVTWRGSGNRRRKILSTLELRMLVEEAVDEVTGAVGRKHRSSSSSSVGGYKAADKLGRWPSGKARDKALNKLAQAKPRHPTEVRRVFQALRIAVNDSHGHMRECLATAPALLGPGGRLAVLSFQPAEDMPVALAGEALTSRALAEDAMPDAVSGASSSVASPLFTSVTGVDPLRPSKAEVAGNPRARSAHLRVYERSASSAVTDVSAAAGAAITAAVSGRISRLLPSLAEVSARADQASKSKASKKTPDAASAAAVEAEGEADEPSFGPSDSFRFTLLTSAAETGSAAGAVPASALPSTIASAGATSDAVAVDDDEAGCVVASVVESLSEPAAVAGATSSVASKVAPSGVRLFSTLTSPRLMTSSSVMTSGARSFHSSSSASAASFSSTNASTNQLTLHPSVDDRVLAKEASMARGRLVHAPKRTGADEGEVKYAHSLNGVQVGEAAARTYATSHAASGSGAGSGRPRLQDATLRRVGVLMGQGRSVRGAALAKGLVALRLRALRAQDAMVGQGKRRLTPSQRAALADWQAVCDPSSITTATSSGSKATGAFGRASTTYYYDANGKLVVNEGAKAKRAGEEGVAVRAPHGGVVVTSAAPSASSAGASVRPYSGPLGVALPRPGSGSGGGGAGSGTNNLSSSPAAEGLRQGMRARRSMLAAMASSLGRQSQQQQQQMGSGRQQQQGFGGGGGQRRGLHTSSSVAARPQPAQLSSIRDGLLFHHPSVDTRLEDKEASMRAGRVISRQPITPTQATGGGSVGGSRASAAGLQPSTLRAAADVMASSTATSAGLDPAAARAMARQALKALSRGDARAPPGSAAAATLLTSLAGGADVKDPTTGATLRSPAGAAAGGGGAASVRQGPLGVARPTRASSSGPSAGAVPPSVQALASGLSSRRDGLADMLTAMMSEAQASLERIEGEMARDTAAARAIRRQAGAPSCGGVRTSAAAADGSSSGSSSSGATSRRRSRRASTAAAGAGGLPSTRDMEALLASMESGGDSDDVSTLTSQLAAAEEVLSKMGRPAAAAAAGAGAGATGRGPSGRNPLGPTADSRRRQAQAEAERAAARAAEEAELDAELDADVSDVIGGDRALRAVLAAEDDEDALAGVLGAKGDAAADAGDDDEPAPLPYHELKRVAAGLGINLLRLTPDALGLGDDDADEHDDDGGGEPVVGGRGQGPMTSLWAEALTSVDMESEGPGLPTHDGAGKALSERQRRAIAVAASTLAYMPTDVAWEQLAGSGVTLESLLAATGLGSALGRVSSAQLTEAIRKAARDAIAKRKQSGKA